MRALLDQRTKAQRNAARMLVSLSIRFGLLSRPETCSLCGAGGVIQAHHADYAKPLDVQWLCTRCHGKEHYMGGPTTVAVCARLTHVEAFMLRSTAYKLGMTPSAFVRYAIKRFLAEQKQEAA